MIKKKFGRAGVLIIALLVSAFGFSGGANAKGPYANIKATAECIVHDGNLLDVLVGYEEKAENTTPPAFLHETVILEKHIPQNLSPGPNTWIPVDADLSNATSPDPLLDLDTGSLIDVENFDLCSISSEFSDANALRAVVILTVDNANAKRKSGLEHTARCVSFPPPVC